MTVENGEVTEAVTTAESKKSPVVLILIIVVVLLVIGGAAAGYFIFIAPNMKTAQNVAPQMSEVQPQVQAVSPGIGVAGPPKKMESFIVNLTDAQGTRYLKIIMQLEMSNQMLEQEIDMKTPQIRDEVIMLLSSKSFDDVSTIAGKRALKRGILNGINKYLTTGRVLRIYFCDFVVQ